MVEAPGFLFMILTEILVILALVLVDDRLLSSCPHELPWGHG
ncbi:MAG TPA: hypothetical protein PKA58_28525 [Polyangium sp.]|nr:hypothetical protein [Polyangium sp.]